MRKDECDTEETRNKNLAIIGKSGSVLCTLIKDVGILIVTTGRLPTYQSLSLFRLDLLGVHFGRARGYRAIVAIILEIEHNVDLFPAGSSHAFLA